MTSRANTVAVRGVPNRAENTPLMPHRVARGRSFSPRCRSLPAWKPRPPPICRAAPSRPALPPHRWVMTVDTKITGTRRMGTLSPKCTDSMMALVPLPSRRQSLYSPTMARPPTGSRYRIQGCAPRMAVA